MAVHDRAHEWGMPQNMKTAIALLACLVVSSCGMAKAVHTGGQTFDKYGCLARDFKGEQPCSDSGAPPKP